MATQDALRMTPEELQARMARGEPVVVLDVRTEDALSVHLWNERLELKGFHNELVTAFYVPEEEWASGEQAETKAAGK